MARQKHMVRKLKLGRQKFSGKMQKKLVLIFVLTILAFLVLIGRVTHIGATRGGEYTRLVLSQQTFENRIIPFQRGNIVDRNGMILATSQRVYNVILDVFVLTAREQSVEPTIRAVVYTLGIDEGLIRSTIEEHPYSRYQILAREVSFERARAFYNYIEDSEHGSLINGIWLEDSFLRIYPYNSLASSLIGFSASCSLGVLGIEKQYNDILSGINGREFGYFATETSLERTIQSPRNGHTVVTTIDVTVQSIVERHIREFNEANAGRVRQGEPGSNVTAVLVMDPNNGEILAMAHTPGFDLNSPHDLSVIYSREQISMMTSEERYDARNALWRNFAVSDTFEPGSTVKSFTVVAGLETGVLQNDDWFYCGGMLPVADFDIHCHLRTGHGQIDVEGVVAFSCNVATMLMAKEIGAEDFVRYQEIFGFGQYTGIDLPGEANTRDLIYHADNMRITDLATNAFGQNFNVTMIQVASAFSSLVNGGNLYVPRVVRQIQDETGRVIESKPPILLRRTVSDATVADAIDQFEAVMVYGTGISANVPGYIIGGKTGTAEKLPRDQGNYLLSFIGFAPLENPQVLIYVVIDEPNIPVQSDGEYVRRLSMNIMKEIFPHLNIPIAYYVEKDEGEDYGSQYYY